LTVFGDRAEAGDTAWGRVLWLGGRYGSAVDTGFWLGHVRRAWRGGDLSRIGNRKTEGRYFWVGRSAKLLDGGLTEVSASCYGVNLAGPAFGAGRAAKAFSKWETGGGGRYFRVGSCAKLLDRRLTEVSASCCGVNLAGPAFGAGRGCKGFLKMGNGRWRAVLSSGILCEVAGRAVDGSISFLLWGEPGRQLRGGTRRLPTAAGVCRPLPEGQPTDGSHLRRSQS
jgi:hypothetical protein